MCKSWNDDALFSEGSLCSLYNKTCVNYLDKCIREIESIKKINLLQGMGELMDDKTKKFVRTKMHTEVLQLLQFYRDFPIIG